jgi:RNA polymerase-binding transcription factor DksA
MGACFRADPEVIDMDATLARTLLEAEARRLGLSTAAGTAAPLAPPEPDPDAVAAGADLLERELALAVAVGMDAERRAVLDALARLDAGTYGRCASCDAPIPDERLEAVPATRFCLPHETAAETALEASGVDGVETGRDPSELVRAEAQRNLDLLPDDEEAEPDLVPVEESAVHLQPDR